MNSKSTREAFGEKLVELGRINQNIVVVDADLSKSTMTMGFAKEFKDRHFDVGIAEGNMIGIGAGLALSGKIPFICSFACFLVNRFEQIRMSIAYTYANVKIVGTHAGIGIGEDGYSQMGLEDVALIRSLPNISVIQPADEFETKSAVEYMANHNEPFYIRLTRQKLVTFNSPDYKFSFGKGILLKDGKDITIIATGATVYNALIASEELSKENISAQVVNIHTIKPIDEDLIIDCAKKTGKIVTVEDHSITGGLGSAVCEVLSEKFPTKVLRIGMKTFGESGTTEALYEKYGLSVNGIKREISRWLDS